MSISKSTCLLLFLISEIFTQTVTQNTCAYTNSATIHPNHENECLYQPAENGVCCFVTTTSDENWCLDLPIEKGKQIDTNSASYSYIKEYKCPTPSKVVNNCGLVGILEPISLANCSSITIPESHCCYIEIEVEDGTQQTHVCRRVKKKPKNKEVSDSVKNEIKSLGANAKSVECFSMFYRVSYILLITFAFILA